MSQSEECVHGVWCGSHCPECDPVECAGCGVAIQGAPHKIDHEFGGAIMMTELFCSENCASNEMERRYDRQVESYYGG